MASGSVGTLSTITPMPEHLLDQLQEAVQSQSEHKLLEAFQALPEEHLKQAVEHLKTTGNKHFEAGQYQEAIDQYSLALLGAPLDYKIYGNRSLVHLKRKQYAEAIADADACIRINKDWPKGYYRKACAYLAQQKPNEALPLFRKTLELEPGNTEAKLQFQQAEKMAAMLDQFIQAANTEPGRPPAPLESEINDLAQICADKPKFFTDMAEVSFHPENRWYKDSPVAQGMHRYLETQCSLWSVKSLLSTLEEHVNTVLLTGALMQEHIRSSPKLKVAIIGSGAGLLPLMASEARAVTTYAVDHYHYESTVTRAVIERNKFTQMRTEYGARLKELTAEQLKSKVAAFANDIHMICKDPRLLDYTDIPEKCDLLVVNLPHYSLLGPGLIPIVQNAQRQYLTDDAVIFPCRAKVYAVGIELVTNTAFDMSPFTNKYSWSINVQPIDLRVEPHKILTKPFEVFDFVMKSRNSLAPVEHKPVEVPTVTSGTLHGFVYYYELFLTDTVSVSNSALSSGGLQAIYYVDPLPVTAESALSVLVSHNKSRITFALQPAATAEACPHEFQAPEWMRAMVNDTYRTECYTKAIESYCRKQEGNEVSVLSFCSSPGVIAMIAAQQEKVRHVYATEKNEHLAETTKAVIARNGLSEKITVINKEPRNLLFGWGEYQHSHYDLHERPDCIILELFDNACVGEGVLYYCKFIKYSLVTPRKTPTLIPCGAKIKGALVELRSTRINGYDVGAPLNMYRWSPEMATVDLKTTAFKQLSDEFELFNYDFYTASPDDLPSVQLSVPIIQTGIVTAVVIWFDLKMDEETTYSTSPFNERSPHLKQGIVYLNELKVSVGAEIPLIAHNKGAEIVFAVGEHQLRTAEDVKILPLPRLDPKWKEHLQKTEELAKSLQSRMQVASEFKAITQACLKMGIQPTNFGLDAQVVTRFCNTFFTSVTRKQK